MVALGLYAEFYLQDTVILVGCIFIPLIYLCVLTWMVAWVKNEYQLLADIEDYNKRMKKKYEIEVKRKEILDKNTKLGDRKKELMMTTVKKKNKNSGFFESTMNRVNSLIEEEKSDAEMQLKSEVPEKKEYAEMSPF